MKAARKNKIAPESTNKAVARKLQEKFTICFRSTIKGGARKLQEKIILAPEVLKKVVQENYKKTTISSRKYLPRWCKKRISSRST
jgi:hypothetical protein